MRSTTIRAESLSLELQQQIDACCDKFELALKQGQSPELAEYLRDLPPAGHVELRREFLAIELAYQRTQARRDSQGLHLRCPHCQNQVELLDDARLEEITCNSCGDTFSLIDEDATSDSPQASQRVAHFELITRLGTGGFGTVWEARDTELDRLVALKIPRKSQLTTRETEQFFREARTAAQLKHPNIVPVHEVGKAGSVVFIVTDLIHGVPLSDWLKEMRPTVQETVQLCATLAEALAYAHQQGVIHRDLKPSNVMLDRDHQPHIMDFGLAKRELGEITMTIDGTVLGTPAYMSPEQAQGKSHWIDRRTDIYSMGVMLFQMLTGELPYRGTAQQQIQQRVVDDAPDPRKLNAHVPADLATICLKCLERDANRRFANAGEFAAELRRFLAGEPIKSRPISNFKRAVRWAKRKPALATAGILTCFLAIAGPLAAVTILSRNQTIETQLVERNNVIAREEKEKKELSKQLRQARQDLLLFQQRNPDRVELADWRKRFIADFIDQNQPARKSLLQGDSRPSTNEALKHLAGTHLGWVYLLRSAEEPTQALEHSLVAQQLLSELLLQNPKSVPYRILLAECFQELSELQTQVEQGEQASQSAEAALRIRSALTNEHPELLAYQIEEYASREWQLSQLQTGTISSDEKKQSLADWQRLKNDLQQKLSANTANFYSLACFLTQREPRLGNDLAPVPASQVLEQDKID
ncbi:MAG: serine/threonine protein kinase [Planctomycetes bacterium]|nr:serine/threonine protein kinase [Planctomycetota bacterium]